MSKNRFVYVVYIAAPPEKVFDALLDPATTAKYWQHENVSDWKPGSKWEHRSTDAGRALHLVGEVVESSRPRRLVVTWAFPEDEKNAGKHTRVTFEIEPEKGVSKLTVIHDDLEAGSPMQQGIESGWPKVLSSLKTLLETGQALPKLW